MRTTTLRLGFFALLLCLFPARRIATHHILDAAAVPLPLPLLPTLPLSYRPLTQAEALQSGRPLPKPCQADDPTKAYARNAQRPLPGREQLSINLGERRSAYLGTLHAHTAASDGEGSVEEAYRDARDLAHLDFFAVTDHPEYWVLHPQQMFDEGRRIAAAAARPDFVPLYGFEYSHPWLGHYVVLNTSAVRRAYDLTLQPFYRWLDEPAQADALVMFAHPGFHDYRFAYEFAHFAFEPALVGKMIAVEVIHWSEYLRYFRGYFGLRSYIDEAIAKGWWVGAAGSQDVHYANWGTRDATRMGLLLAKLSLPDILQALRERHFYATNNRDLQFAVNVQRRDGSWAMMGDHVSGAELVGSEADIKVRYYDGDCLAPPYRLEAVLAGEVVAAYDYPAFRPGQPFPFSAEFSLRLPLQSPALPRQFPLYFRFYQGDDHETFTESSALFFSL